MKLVTPRHAIDHKPQANDFAVIEAEAPSCPPGGVLARVIHVSLDPYIGSALRGRHMGHTPPVPMKDPVNAAVVAQVIKSDTEKVAAGDYIYSMDGAWAETIALNAEDIRKVSPEDAPLSAYLGVLGMPGLTAWAGVTQLAEVGKGDVFLVDAAAGPVGGTAGQIARIKGASSVVGIAGGPEKCGIVKETYGFDTCVDYKDADWRDALAEALPGGLTAFFENVSADMAMIALSHARPYARGILCGLVDAYHSEEQSQHPINAGMIIGKRAKLMGLVVYDFYPRWDEFIAEASAWIREGRLRFQEDRANGLDALPSHFERLMNGENQGKALVQIAPEKL
ncbi:MDR family NADP-dependent oxidoreductase [Parvularcula lutaonensis]|uniref:Zinc-binding dehydrogenase n=1 Tax=Parvularcula lutaonensis TaxID=491923 RepID=A0ABV7MAP8_9PROT|nr:NADP-dependent oxidoreductase [Parvularcula lutaonensis]GGY38535.1 NADP-dependent oxidoreductase [Parvularcula lutaonensis]